MPSGLIATSRPQPFSARSRTASWTESASSIRSLGASTSRPPGAGWIFVGALAGRRDRYEAHVDPLFRHSVEAHRDGSVLLDLIRGTGVLGKSGRGK